MIKRDLQDGTSLFILQEDHADLAAQFAAHWGNERFAKLEPSESMVFAGIYHDSDHRETEADIPIDSEKNCLMAIELFLSHRRESWRYRKISIG